MPFCSKCGTSIAETQSFCSSCGEKINGSPEVSSPASSVREESGTLIFLMALFFGCWGIHQFIAGNTKRGLVYLLCATLGACLIVPVLVIFILVLIDLFRIAKGDFYSDDKTIHYQGAVWMKVLAFLWVFAIPLLLILGIVAALAIPKMYGMNDKAMASEVSPVAGTYIKLQEAYYAETGSIGNWEQMGYVAPGENSETENFVYSDLNPGLVAMNKKEMGDCSVGNKWTVIPEVVTTENGNSDIRFTVIPPGVEACDLLTPNFSQLR